VGASLRMRRETSWFGLMLMDCNVCGDGPGVHQCGVCVCKRDVGMHRRGCKDMNPQGDVRGADTAVPGSDCGFECWRAPSWHLHLVVTPLEEEEKTQTHDNFNARCAGKEHTR
jgi:hypothetical protein